MLRYTGDIVRFVSIAEVAPRRDFPTRGDPIPPASVSAEAVTPWCRIGAIRTNTALVSAMSDPAWLSGNGVTVAVVAGCRSCGSAEGGTRTHTRFPPPDFEKPESVSAWFGRAG